MTGYMEAINERAGFTSKITEEKLRRDQQALDRVASFSADAPDP